MDVAGAASSEMSVGGIQSGSGQVVRGDKIEKPGPRQAGVDLVGIVGQPPADDGLLPGPHRGQRRREFAPDLAADRQHQLGAAACGERLEIPAGGIGHVVRRADPAERFRYRRHDFRVRIRLLRTYRVQNEYLHVNSHEERSQAEARCQVRRSTAWAPWVL